MWVKNSNCFGKSETRGLACESSAHLLGSLDPLDALASSCGGGGEEGEGGRGVGGEVHDWEGFEERLVHRVITSRGAKPCRLL